MADVQINDLPIESTFDGTENLPLQNTSDETKRGLLSSLGSFFAKVLTFSADLKTTNDTLVGAINELNDCANIADEYDSSHTYNTGDRVIYEGVLKVCNDDNVTGAWDSTKWDSATVDEIISALKVQDLDNVNLTTSDNNKLLGVSVSGSDISVGAVSSLFKIVAFNLASCTVNANSVRVLRGNEFTDTTDVIPTGYSPIAISGEYSINNSIKFIKVEATQAGGIGVFVTLGNDTANNQTGYIQVKILYIKNSLL